MTDARPHRAAFAALLDRLMREGVNARTAKGAKAATWSDAALAARHDDVRADGGEATTSPRSVANWRKGKVTPANVEPLIAAIYGDPPNDRDAAERLRTLYRRAVAEDLDRRAQEARERTGNLFDIGEDQARIVKSIGATDLAMAGDANHAKLQNAVRRDADLLAQRLVGVEDDGTAREVAQAAEELQVLAALPAASLVERLTDLFIAVTRLGGLNKSDSLRGGEIGRNLPPLPAGGAGALSALTQLSYAWALGFPAVKALEARGATAQEVPATSADASALFETAREQDAIGAVDAQTLRRMTEAANPDTLPGQTAERMSTLYGENFAATAAQGIALAASGDEAAEPFARRATATLQQRPAEAERFAGSELAREALRIGVETFAARPPPPEPHELRHVFVSYAHQDNRERPPGDERGWKDWAMSYLTPLETYRPIRFWVDSDLRGGDEWEAGIREKLARCDIFVLLISRHAMGSSFIVDVEIATALARRARSEDTLRIYGVVLTPTPDALLDPVRRFLLRPQDGRALALWPPHERDHAMAKIADEITALARELTQPVPDDVEARAHTLILAGKAPPASWTPHIRSLDFAGEDLADAAPLAGLTALTTLNLGDTQIADAAPLAGLTALTMLDLSYSRIADAAPLAGLKALTSLDLRGTRIIDAAPLAGLTALTSLNLWNTQITDAAPLAGLTALTSFDLMGTKISDAAPLAGLTALTSLDLANTQIADAAPLAGLTALTKLDLMNTKVADLTPLAGLARLTELDLTGAPVTDLAPLAVLEVLETLYLDDPPADLAPLAGLIANGLKISRHEFLLKTSPSRPKRAGRPTPPRRTPRPRGKA